MQTVKNVLENSVKFKPTNQSCSLSKISQSINMQLTSTVVLIRSLDKVRGDVTEKNHMKDISKLHRILLNISVKEAFQRTAKLFMADFLQNKLHEGNAMLVKVN